jgi:hypothetical protein
LCSRDSTARFSHVRKNLPLREIFRYRFLDPEHIVALLAQYRDNRTRSVLVGEQPHDAVQDLTAKTRSERTTSRACAKQAWMSLATGPGMMQT